jgi:hypothetical protein
VGENLVWKVYYSPDGREWELDVIVVVMCFYFQFGFGLWGLR